MRRCIEGFIKVQDECVNLSASILNFSAVVYYCCHWVSQLCISLNICCLSDRCLCCSRWAIKLVQTVCSVSLQRSYERKKGRYLLARHIGGHIFAKDYSLWISLVSRYCWKKCANAKSNSLPSPFNTLGCNSSCSKALEGFRPFRSLVTPSFGAAIFFIRGADLSSKGVCLCSFYWTHHCMDYLVPLPVLP